MSSEDSRINLNFSRLIRVRLERGTFPEKKPARSRTLICRLFLVSILSLLASYRATAAGRGIEVRSLGAAQVRIDFPEKWNNELVLVLHGLEMKPVSYDQSPAQGLVAALIKEGYAVAQTGYSEGGWAIDAARKDTEKLHEYFSSHYGKPQRTFLVGHSMGAFISMVLLEQNPMSYDGALALCGPLAPSDWFMARRAFDVRVVFDSFFPDVLPRVDQVPATYKLDPAEMMRIAKLLDGSPEKASNVRQYANVESNRDLGIDLVLFTYLIGDLERRASGNPFDNRNIIYTGTGNDGELNQSVVRYTASPNARSYLAHLYRPTGKLSVPLLSVETAYDPLIPGWVSNFYEPLANAAGNPDLFRQTYTLGKGHCAFTPEQELKAFSELVEWQSSKKISAKTIEKH